ncbi:MAG: uroporphyrinogen-III synthase [Balneolaceae bacterium]|nr:uroporphyrinogen-III synthase [Balneolaceae bacterium]MCH8549631.1 uroporphyrinogen-III synthase [Balneolaceae bacterium]
MSEPRNILMTRELTDEQIALAEELGLRVRIEPAIEIRFRDDWLSVQGAFRNVSNVIYAFTSQNGVKGFERFRKAGVDFPKGPVYAVGGRTAEALREIGLPALWPERQDGVGLAETIISDIEELYGGDDVTIFHFCGNRRRDELRQILSQSDITVMDLVVYSTELKMMKLDGEPDAVLFYSPSAVQAYRNSGGFQKGRKPELFAIGDTTARELSIESGRHVHVSPEPDTEVFLRYVANVLNEPVE